MQHFPRETFEAVGKAQRAIKKRMVSYIAAGFGLVAGLAWNDAIKVMIEYFIPNTGNTVIAKLLYAIIITLFVGLVLYYLEKSIEKDERTTK